MSGFSRSHGTNGGKTQHLVLKLRLAASRAFVDLIVRYYTIARDCSIHCFFPQRLMLLVVPILLLIVIGLQTWVLWKVAKSVVESNAESDGEGGGRRKSAWMAKEEGKERLQ